jgi:hypothetical protein
MSETETGGRTAMTQEQSYAVKVDIPCIKHGAECESPLSSMQAIRDGIAELYKSRHITVMMYRQMSDEINAAIFQYLRVDED